MTKQSKRFPLTKHPNGQYCKKIRGKLFYFGTDRDEALRDYYLRAASLHSGQTDGGRPRASLTVEDICNLFLTNQRGRLEAGEIKGCTFED